MKVKRLQMQSFRGIGDLTLEFDQTSPTALIGINGVGKSSILDCLAILLSQLIRDIAYAESIGKNRSLGGVNFSVVSKIRNEYEKSIPGKPDIEKRFFSEEDITNGQKKTHNSIKIFLQSKEVSWFLTNFSKERSEELNKENAELNTVSQDIYRKWEANPQFNLPLAVYYPVKRSVLGIDMEITETHSLKQIDAYDQALNGVQISFHRFFQWFRSLEDLENEERRDNPEFKTQQLEAVRQSIYSLIPGFSNLRVRRSPLRMTVRKQGEELIVNAGFMPKRKRA